MDQMGPRFRIQIQDLWWKQLEMISVWNSGLKAGDSVNSFTERWTLSFVFLCVCQKCSAVCRRSAALIWQCKQKRKIFSFFGCCSAGAFILAPTSALRGCSFIPTSYQISDMQVMTCRSQHYCSFFSQLLKKKTSWKRTTHWRDWN